MRFEREVGFIWDIDGVVVDSPHEEAWRETSLRWGAKEFPSDFYFAHVASKPRYEGGHAILEKLGIYERLGARGARAKRDALNRFCDEKNRMIRRLIREGKFRLFEDATAFVLESKARGVKQVAASASKNARDMLVKVGRGRLREVSKRHFDFLKPGVNLHAIFDADACGVDVKGKEGILGYAAKLLQNSFGVKRFVVFEDAPAGVRAARNLGYFAVGVRKIGTREALERAGANLVVDSLSEISYPDLRKRVLDHFKSQSAR